MTLVIWDTPHQGQVWNILLRTFGCDPYLRITKDFSMGGLWSNVSYAGKQSDKSLPTDILMLKELIGRPKPHHVVLQGVDSTFAHERGDGTTMSILLNMGAIATQVAEAYFIFLDVTDAGGQGYRAYNDAGATVALSPECRLYHMLHFPVLNQSAADTHLQWQARAIAENDFRKRHSLPLRSAVNWEDPGVGPAAIGSNALPDCATVGGKRLNQDASGMYKPPPGGQ